jgi:NADH-quinone oxidoreductase subunit I
MWTLFYSLPSECIELEGDENEQGERFAKTYEINMLRCIFCGYCEEVCPEEAIFLRQDYELASEILTIIFTIKQIISSVKEEEEITNFRVNILCWKVYYF